MYALAARLDPETMYEVGLRVYEEMAAAGYGAVGEFHYVHHQPDGTPYEDPNEMAKALALAAERCGLDDGSPAGCLPPHTAGAMELTCHPSPRVS